MLSSDLGMEVKPTSLIVTLRMEAPAAARFTALRQAHFPPDRNWLAAHITLFHALPVASVERVLTDAAELASATDAFSMRVERVLFLGRGVAYGIAAPPAVGLRKDLADRWAPLLGRQDRAWHGRLHVTVQNKVESATARALTTACSEPSCRRTLGRPASRSGITSAGRGGPRRRSTSRRRAKPS